MPQNAAQPPANTSATAQRKAAEEARLAKALRDNLKRRKAASAGNTEPGVE